MRGRTVVVSDETRKKISDRIKGVNHPMYKKPLSEKRKIALNRTGAISEKRKRVYQYKDGNLVKEYDFIAQVRDYGFQNSKVSLCCSGKRTKHKGYQWSFTKI